MEGRLRELEAELAAGKEVGGLHPVAVAGGRQYSAVQRDVPCATVSPTLMNTGVCACPACPPNMCAMPACPRPKQSLEAKEEQLQTYRASFGQVQEQYDIVKADLDAARAQVRAGSTVSARVVGTAVPDCPARCRSGTPS